jgi:hypothetical protein
VPQSAGPARAAASKAFLIFMMSRLLPVIVPPG